MKYLYSFSPWPDETWGLDPAVFTLFSALDARLEMTLTEAEFERFRSGLSHHGITLREVERVPWVKPESIP